MSRDRIGFRLALTAATALAAMTVLPGSAHAQSLMDLGDSELRSALETRYDEALGLTLDPAIINANDPRYTWASEAKIQCAIAIGYMKSSTRDPVSIGKCEDAYGRMRFVPPPPPPAPPPPPPPQPGRPDYCDEALAGIVFFDWDSAVPLDSTGPTIDTVVNRYQTCGWSGLSLVGHTDRSGSNAYNDGLSMRRAEAIASLLSGRGIAAGNLSVSARGEEQPRVPTPDGERNPQNRRVEISAK